MAIALDIRAEFRDVLQELRTIERNLGRTVIARTLNRLGDQVKTKATREISGSYNITARKVRERIQVRKAFREALSVTVEVQSKFGRRATNLITFGARQLKRGGVSVKIRKDRPPLKGAKWFVITNRTTQGTFVARRTGKGRKDIESVMTIDVGQMFNAKRVNEELLKLVRQRFPDEFARQFRFATKR
jgi:hypothetical protein